MEHYIYIIYSNRLNTYYKGYSTTPERRLEEHNNNQSEYTKNKGPWELVYIEKFTNKRDAIIREKAIKKYGHVRITQLILSKKNKLSEIFDKNQGIENKKK